MVQSCAGSPGAPTEIVGEVVRQLEVGRALRARLARSKF
jgi:hypothetical protein